MTDVIINRTPMVPGKTDGPITTEFEAGSGNRKAINVYIKANARITNPDMIFLFI